MNPVTGEEAAAIDPSDSVIVELEETTNERKSGCFCLTRVRNFFCSGEPRSGSEVVAFLNKYMFQTSSSESKDTTYFVCYWKEEDQLASWDPKNITQLSQIFQGFDITCRAGGTDSTKKSSLKTDKVVPIFDYWRRSMSRKMIDEKIFHPGKLKGFTETAVSSIFNTWSGMAFDKSVNSRWILTHPLASETIGRLKYHLFSVICRKDREIFSYVKRWLAFCVQNPDKQTEVVLVISGEQGAGKSVFFKNYLKLFGNHGVFLAKQRDLFARFSSVMLDDKVMVQVDEIDMSDAKKSEELKCFIGAPMRRKEGKYMTPGHGRNWINFIFTTNKRFCLPLETGYNRRFMHVHASDDHVNDKSYGKEFDEMMNQNSRLGLRVLYHWLSNVNLFPRVRDTLTGEKTAIRKPWDSSPPVTEEARSQQIVSASDIDDWWLGILAGGCHHEVDEYQKKNGVTYIWDQKAPKWLRFPSCIDDLFSSYKSDGKRKHLKKIEFLQIFRTLVPHTHDLSETAANFTMPPLVKCKKHMNSRFPGYFKDDGGGFLTAAKKRILHHSKKPSSSAEKKAKKTDDALFTHKIPKYFQTKLN